MNGERDLQATIREATLADVAMLVRHRRLMFEEMRAVQPVGYSAAEATAIAPAYAAYVQDNLGASLRAWIAEVDGRTAGSGGLLFYDWLPRPGDTTGRAALLHSIYTEAEFRRLGLARRITQTMLDACRKAGIRTVNLHASQAGQPLYTALGFHQTSEMRLILETLNKDN